MKRDALDLPPQTVRRSGIGTIFCGRRAIRPHAHIPIKSDPPTHTTQIRSALAICHKQLGDVLLLEPALWRIREATGSPVDLITRSGHAPLIQLMDSVRLVPHAAARSYPGGVFAFDESGKTALHAALAFSQNKTLVLRDPSDRRAWHRVAFRSIQTPGLADAYVGQYAFEHCLAGDAPDFRPPRLNRPPDAWRPPEFPPAPYLLINATSGWKSKTWSPTAWAQVARRALEADVVESVVLTSGGQDWQIEHTSRAAAKVGPAARLLGGQTTLEQFLWLIAHARAVAGVDGAASHIAAALGVPNITAFTTTSERNWFFPAAHSRAVRVVGKPDTPTREAHETGFAEILLELLAGY